MDCRRNLRQGHSHEPQTGENQGSRRRSPDLTADRAAAPSLERSQSNSHPPQAVVAGNAEQNRKGRGGGSPSPSRHNLQVEPPEHRLAVREDAPPKRRSGKGSREKSEKAWEKRLRGGNTKRERDLLDEEAEDLQAEREKKRERERQTQCRKQTQLERQKRCQGMVDFWASNPFH
ncbi:hypothetical protein IWX49DRAFT_107390 [Phyllosticta citricarpa]|uniref:Uncharacterized protein n=2 Tax=Phyllosticta TaxID=121621 RepID=A0ABR1MEJ4_9PEZI